MSHRSRQEAARRARELGAQARRKGMPQTANPYKPGGAWSLPPHWWAGWTLANNKPANVGIEPPYSVGSNDGLGMLTTKGRYENRDDVRS